MSKRSSNKSNRTAESSSKKIRRNPSCESNSNKEVAEIIKRNPNSIASNVKGEILSFLFKNNTYDYVVKGSFKGYVCNECWDHGKTIKARLIHFVIQEDEHCKECKNKQNEEQVNDESLTEPIADENRRQTRSMSRARSVSRAGSVFKDRIVHPQLVPIERYELKKKNNNSKFAGVIIFEDNDQGMAREFSFQKRKKDGLILFNCTYCNKTFLEYNEDTKELYWFHDEGDHDKDYDCRSVPRAVLDEKYEIIKDGKNLSTGWWEKQGKKFNFNPGRKFRTIWNEKKRQK